MAKTKAYALSNKSKGLAYESGKGYKGVKRQGSKYGWFFEDGKTRQSKGGFDTAEEAAYHYDEFLIAYHGGDAETNQAMGYLKTKQVLEIREKLNKAERPKKTSHAIKRGATGLKGVHLLSKDAVTKPWAAQVAFGGKLVNIGTYKTALEAARAYDLAALRYKGTDAETNLSLGLVPPFGKDAQFVEPDIEEIRRLKREKQKHKSPVKVEINVAKQNQGDASGVKHIESANAPYLTPEAEREAQIIAARAMQDDDINDAEDCGGTPESESNSEPKQLDSIQAIAVSTLTPEEPAPTITTELIVMSEADKLRAKAEAFLREAAELDARNAKEQTLARLDVLTGKLSSMQETMLRMIDCTAEIELEIHKIKESLK